MSSCNEVFKLSADAVNLIECSIRAQLTKLSRITAFATNNKTLQAHKQTVELMQVMGALHNQKIWYSQIRQNNNNITLRNDHENITVIIGL